MAFDRADQADRIITQAPEQGSGDMARQAGDNSSPHNWGQFANSDSAASHLPGLTIDDGSSGTPNTADANLTNVSAKGANDTTASAAPAASDGSTAAGATSDTSSSKLLANIEQDLQTLLKDETQLATELQALLGPTGSNASTSTGDATSGTPNTSTGEAAAGTPNTSTGEARRWYA